MRFAKEIALIAFTGVLLLDGILNKRKIRLDGIDIFIGLYIISLVVVSFFSGRLSRVNGLWASL
jgi:hypothetical protein